MDRSKEVEKKRVKDIRRDRLKRIWKTEVKPADEWQMSVRSRKGTICRCLRDIYAKVEDPEIRLQLRVAVTMAKKMNRRLEYYHSRYPEDENKPIRLNQG